MGAPTMHDASEMSNVHSLIAVLIIVIGFVLMIGKMIVDSEPGGIPILLVLVGTGWYGIQRIKSR